MKAPIGVLVRSLSKNDSNLTRDTGFDYWLDEDTPLEVDGVRKIAESAVTSLVKEHGIPRKRVTAVFVHVKKNVYRFTSFTDWFGTFATDYALKFEEVSKEK
jgi:hypothetical protein